MVKKSKYEYLISNTLSTIDWVKLATREPELFFVYKDYAAKEKYDEGFSVNELFLEMSSGVKTHRDHFVVSFDVNELENKIRLFFNHDLSDDDIRSTLNLKDNRDWGIRAARTSGGFDSKLLSKILYRPFDTRPIYYDSNLIDFGRENIMDHILKGSVAFVCFRQSRNNEKGTFWLSNNIVGKDAISSLDTCSIFPLYVYPDVDGDLLDVKDRKPNIDKDEVSKIKDRLGLQFSPEFENNKVTPIVLLDYIYSVLYSPNYREIYKEFIKTDFPRISYPTNKANFWQLVKLGGELRQLHLMESHKLEDYIAQYPVSGDNVVTRPIGKNDFEITSSKNRIGRVWINENQYFDAVPELAWDFYIGGYQPAQKWLKDRKGRTLDVDDIFHYQKIIVALTETDRVMHEIDKVLVI